MNAVNGGEPQGDIPPLSGRPGAHVQFTHVPGPDMPAGRVSFAAAVSGFGHRYDPSESVDPGVPNEPGVLSVIGNTNGVAELPLLFCQRKPSRLVESLSISN